MQVWNLLHAARWKHRMQKSRQKSPSGHHRTTLSDYIFATKTRIDNRKKNLLSSNMFITYPNNMVNFGLLATEIGWPVWGTPANFNGFRVLSLVVGVSQTLRRWTEGATYIRQGDHHVGHWPTFLVLSFLHLQLRSSMGICLVSWQRCFGMTTLSWPGISIAMAIPKFS